MTDTTTHAGTVEHIDPTTLVIEANVRPSAPVTAAFVQSIRENGVLTPVLARRDDQGNVLVRAGQRRTLAAREAERATIPVYIVDANAASVNTRYHEDNAYVYEYRTPQHTEWSPVEILSALNCYEYQACEVEDWASSEAKQFCDRLRRLMESRLPGASDGPWEITTDTEPALTQLRAAARRNR